MKRKSDNEASHERVSPPPLKKHVKSTTNRKPQQPTREIQQWLTSIEKAVSNFFKPASQKEPEKLVWRTFNNSLLVGKYSSSSNDLDRAKKRRKDSTLITTSSGNVFGKDASDWKWWHTSVPGKLKSLYSDGYLVVILSNQSGINLNPKRDTKPAKGDPKRLADFKTKVGYVFNQLDIPISIYAATAKDHYRKPRTAMWDEMRDDYDLDMEGEEAPLMEESFFVGDAAGRPARKGIKADHSCSDRDFADNVGISFHTPEEYFLSEPAQPFRRTFDPLLYVDKSTSEAPGDDNPSSTTTDKPVVIEKLNKHDIILLCGSPGSGKSTFYWECLQPLGYKRVNQDILKTREKCLKVAAGHIASGESVVVDNTNADPPTRAHWTALARTSNLPIRCVYLSTPPAVCRHNDAVRGLNIDDQPDLFNPEERTQLPGMAFSGFESRFKEPKVEEGFADVVRVPFVFRGDGRKWGAWKCYWF